jgi:hypothetical protein
MAEAVTALAEASVSASPNVVEEALAAGLMETIEQDDNVFMELDRSPVSFDLAVFGSPGAHLSTLSRTLDAHLQSVAVSTLNPGKAQESEDHMFSLAVLAGRVLTVLFAANTLLHDTGGGLDDCGRKG